MILRLTHPDGRISVADLTGFSAGEVASFVDLWTLKGNCQIERVDA